MNFNPILLKTTKFPWSVMLLTSVYDKMHLWKGLVTGIVLSTVCLTWIFIEFIFMEGFYLALKERRWRGVRDLLLYIKYLFEPSQT